MVIKAHFPHMIACVDPELGIRYCFAPIFGVKGGHEMLQITVKCSPSGRHAKLPTTDYDIAWLVHY